MQFGWTILHVPDVPETVAFYERAFGLRRRFIDDTGEFAEMETGSTVLAFAAHRLIERMAFHQPDHGRPHGMEIALVTEADQVDAAYRRAVEAGAEAVQAPERKPWGQIVGFVRDPNGFLVEVCSSVPAPPSSGN
jgi:uncharacterized glyoxalase superfamily protein PhnB